MGLPAEIVSRILNVGDVLGLILSVNNQATQFDLQVAENEYPNNYYDFSLGAASALAAAGTDWDEILDASSRPVLEPNLENQVHQGYFGINPGFARIYRAYPPNVVRGGLQVPITVGGAFGYVDGRDSPMRSASPVTEFYTLKGVHPAFNGYHPYGAPSSITVRMSFYMVKYKVKLVQGVMPRRVVTVGGLPPVDAPQWLLDARSTLLRKG